MENRIFCQIVSGELPAGIFYEDEVVFGFVTIKPVTTGHAMVIPKRHAAYLDDHAAHCCCDPRIWRAV